MGQNDDSRKGNLDQQLRDGLIFGYGEFGGRRKILYRGMFDAEIPPERDSQEGGGFPLLAGKARPGTGIVPVDENGNDIGPSGALGLFLEDTSRDTWFLAAGHVLTGFDWNSRPDIYRSRNGLTSCDAYRKLGEVRCVKVLKATNKEFNWNKIDAGVVKLDSKISWKQETTCYGAIGAPMEAKPDFVVRKCGPEEPYSTWGEVMGTDWKIRVVRRERCRDGIYRGIVYLFKDQILVCCRHNHLQPFAMPGDSGSLVVDADGRPVGMLMAGSVRHDFFFLNPIHDLQKFWKRRNLKQADVAETAEEETTIPAIADRVPRRLRAGARTGVGRAT